MVIGVMMVEWLRCNYVSFFVYKEKQITEKKKVYHSFVMFVRTKCIYQLRKVMVINLCIK